MEIPPQIPTPPTPGPSLPPQIPVGFKAAGKFVPPPALTPEQIAEYEAAKKRAVKVRGAIRVATVDAWVAAVFAGCAILSGCMGIENLIIGLALAWVAFNSFKGVRKLRRLDLRGPSDLALNQVVLAACLIAYFSYALWTVSHGKSGIVSMIAGNTNYKEMGLGSMGADIDDIQQMVVSLVKLAYVLMIGGTIIAQGSTALYYRSRKKYFEAYLKQTPQWIIDLQKLQAS